MIKVLLIFFLEMVLQEKIYWVFDIETKKIIINRDVIFYESSYFNRLNPVEDIEKNGKSSIKDFWENLENTMTHTNLMEDSSYDNSIIFRELSKEGELSHPCEI